jgi:hypothetical protein
VRELIMQTQRAYTEIRGHGLQNEGAPHDTAGERIYTGIYYQIGGPGHGRCGCGELSPALPSDYQRKKWHRKHKTEIEGAAS